VERRFPGMVARTRQIGSDLARGPVEVSPTAHFHMGGVVIDRDCRTAIDGLLVAGEDAGGVHGANRLGGNGVAESTVFGARAGDEAARVAARRPLLDADRALVEESVGRAMAPLRRAEGPRPFPLTRRLKDAMWEGCGVVRSREGLLDAAEQIEGLAEEVAAIAVPGPPEVNYAWQEALDLVNQLTVARTIVASALAREESRGAHFRADFPDSDDDNWLRNTIVRRGPNGESEVGFRPVERTRERAGATGAGERG
jgi:succinate dehydrogenase/fumarate reductase flavoprotein subunit